MIAAAILVLLPLVFLTLQVERQVSRHLGDQYGARVEALAELVDVALRGQGEGVGQGLKALARTMSDDPRLRLALVDSVAAERDYQLDYAGNAMALMGLDVLQIQSEDGRILSSGHYRNAFDRPDPDLPALLARGAGEGGLVWIRGVEGPFLALARVDSLRLAGKRFWLVGGREVDIALLDEIAAGSGMAIALRHGPGPGEVLATADMPASALDDSTAAMLPTEGAEAFVRVSPMQLPLIDGGPGREHAEIIVAYPRAPLLDLLGSLRLWLAFAVGATVLGSFILALWLSARISRPISDLAAKTNEIRDIEKLDFSFDSGRTDEVGTLERFLTEMIARLAASTRRLRDAERRATLGEMARQVTHDSGNCFTPLRNVIKHLSEVARDEPSQLPEIYAERRGTLEAGLDYLESLAGHYARISPRARPRRCNLAEILGELIPVARSTVGIEYRLEIEDALPQVEADPVSLRRIVENLLRNAEESLPQAGGLITLRSRVDLDDRGERSLLLEIEDTGAGIRAERLDRIFDDFYTSKEGGSGLGLSIVRRLVADLGGKIGLRSEPGVGSCFTLTLPIALSTDAEPEGRQS